MKAQFTVFFILRNAWILRIVNIGFREHFISYHSTSSLGAGVAGLVNSRQSQGRVACAQCLSVTRRLSAAPVKTRPQAPCHLLAELVPGGSRRCRSAAREQTGGNCMLVTPRVGHVEPARGLSTLGGTQAESTSGEGESSANHHRPPSR